MRHASHGDDAAPAVSIQLMPHPAPLVISSPGAGDPNTTLISPSAAVAAASASGPSASPVGGMVVAAGPASALPPHVCYCSFTVDRRGIIVEADIHSADMFGCRSVCLSSRGSSLSVLYFPFSLFILLHSHHFAFLVLALKTCFITQSHPSFLI